MISVVSIIHGRIVISQNQSNAISYVLFYMLTTSNISFTIKHVYLFFYNFFLFIYATPQYLGDKRNKLRYLICCNFTRKNGKYFSNSSDKDRPFHAQKKILSNILLISIIIQQILFRSWCWIIRFRLQSKLY